MLFTLTGFAAVLSFFAAAWLSTFAYENRLSHYWLIPACMLGCFFYFALCLQSRESESRRKQLRLLNGVLLFVSLVFTFGNLIFGKRFLPAEYVSQACLILCTLAAALKLGAGKMTMTVLWDAVRKHWGILLLSFFCLLHCFDPAMLQFKWDARGYYLASMESIPYSLRSLAAVGHLSQSYTLWNHLWTALAGGETAYGMLLGNFIAYLLSVYVFYASLRRLVPGRKQPEYVLGTAVWAFLPYTLGMADHHSPDYLIMCLFPLLFYLSLTKQWILQFALGLFFVFLKETGILIYGTLSLGCLWIDLTEEPASRRKLRDSLFVLMRRGRYQAWLLTAFLWILMYRHAENWEDGGRSLRFDPAFTTAKLKVLFVINFQWIGSLILILGLLCILLKKGEKKKAQWLPLLLFPWGMFTVFICLYVFYNNVRYSQIFPFCLCLSAVVLLLKFMEKTGSGTVRISGAVILSLWSVLLLLSCFYTFDPLNRLCFSLRSTGGGKILATDTVVDLPIGDGSVYNRQQLWEERALQEALDAARADGDTILLPMLGENSWWFEALQGWRVPSEERYSLAREYYIQGLHWRDAKPREASEELLLYEVSDEKGLRTLMEQVGAECCSFITMDGYGEELASFIRENCLIWKEETYEYRGWRMRRIEFGSPSFG
ncbi:MAG: hypothetical protein IK115_05435 [Lachnospiraceae bacterium]|nr:hypothetical protein [Lachnospiraceae bacterium]